MRISDIRVIPTRCWTVCGLAVLVAEVITGVGNGIVAATFEFMDFMLYNQAIDPTGGTAGVPSVEYGTDVVGQDVLIAISAYTQNL